MERATDLWTSEVNTIMEIGSKITQEPLTFNCASHSLMFYQILALLQFKKAGRNYFLMSIIAKSRVIEKYFSKNLKIMDQMD